MFAKHELHYFAKGVAKGGKLGSQRWAVLALAVLLGPVFPGGKSTMKQGRSEMYLEIGQPAPDFALPDAEGRIHRLSDYRGKKVVLYFYPKDNTPGCTKEACSFRDFYAGFRENGVVVLGVSPDSVSSHKRFAEKYGLPFPLLADPEHEVLKLYGVWREKSTGGKKRWGVVRTTYIIDEEGKISHVFTKVNTAIHGQEVLDALGLSH